MRTLLLLALAACATTPTAASKSGPRGPRVSDHLDQARTHDQLARDHQTLPTPTVMTPSSLETVTPMPWLRTWDTSAEHERLSRIHRSDAAGLQAAYDDACRDRSGTDVTMSPLRRLGGSSWTTRTGVVVELDKAESPDTLLVALRCHRAWMMIAPTAGMDDCALDLPGLVLDARGTPEGVTLVITVDSPKLIPELQRRVAQQLEEHRSHAP